ncbi:MAG: ion channel [Ginsengibacter sp.]
MALLRKINAKAKSEINSGFGSNTSSYGGRFINKNGNANIEKRGLGIFEQISLYHTLLALPRWKFISMIFIYYIVINLVFACIYFLMGPSHIAGMVYQNNIQKFEECFFFSCQTFTTVGYGRVNPVGLTGSGVSAFEALLGLLTIALITGLLFGRFAKPVAYLRFSENALIAPFQGITAFMFRVAPYKNTTLLDAEVKISLAMIVEEDGKMVNKFFPLTLEYEKVNALTISWTIVHPITEVSPLYKYSKQDFAEANGEFLVFLKAFDDMFSNTVVARTSYTFKEIVVGAKFEPMFKRSEEGHKTILHLGKLNAYTEADVSYSFMEVTPDKVVTAGS